MNLRTTKHNGFTLVEVSMSLMILALLSATAAMMVRLPLARAQLAHGVSEVQWLDTLSRHRARGGDSIELQLDLHQHSIRVVNTNDDQIVSEVMLAGDLRFLEVLNMGSQTKTQKRVSYDRFGTCRSFAVQIGREGGQAEWLLVLGTTGQKYVGKQRGTIDAILYGERHHSD